VAEGGSPPAQLRQVHKQSTSPPAVLMASSITGIDVDPATSPPAVLTASSIAGIDVDPALTGAAAIMTSHLQQTKPDEISVKFSNGRLRKYKRVSQATSAAVGERQARRRRKSVASLVSSLATVDPQEIGAVVTGILRRARAQGGISVAPLKALSVQQQLQFKIANKVSGVTWGRFRAFTGDSRLASNQALRAEAARFSTEERNQVATTEDGAFLISPRAAFQAHLDDLVSRGGFVECPVQPDPVMGGRGVGCRRSARGPSSGDARGTAEHDCSVGSRGAGGGESARGLISGDACGTAELDCSVSSRGAGGGESARGPNCGDARDDAEDGSGARGVPSDGGIRGSSPTAGHMEARPPVQLLFGMDKGGRTSSVKVFLGIANQSRPASVGNSVVLGVFPCRTDDYATLQRICAVWLADVEDLRSNGLSVAGELRAVRLILTGDIAWMTAFCGHGGSSSPRP